MATATQIQLHRAPETDDELHALIRAFFGVSIPRVRVCANHVSPFEAVAHAFFAREPGYAVWYASRGSGKSMALAILGLVKTLVLDVDTTILGGSMTQSQNVSMHMKGLMGFGRAPAYALKGGTVEKGITATAITTATGKLIRPIPASQTTVRGPHPPLSLLDECDEMDLEIYDAAMGQAMAQINTRGEVIDEYIVASSTWQNPIGSFSEIMDRARRNGMPIFSWCWRELVQTPANPDGWMTQAFIDRKRKAVSAEMWRTEYELNEPSGGSRAFDLDALERNFITYDAPLSQHIEENDAAWEWEAPIANAFYAVGCDWAKEKDKTVMAVVRYDVYPRRLVALRRVNRKSYREMIKDFDALVKRFHAVGRHDATGLGNVVNDFSDTVEDGTVAGFNFAGRQKRSQMLLGYVTALEANHYRLPRPEVGASVENDALREFYKAHRATTTEDVYGNNSVTKSHLPDDVAAMGLAHLAAGDVPQYLQAQGVPAAPLREVTRHLTTGETSEDGMTYTSQVGDVTVDREMYAAIADLSGGIAESGDIQEFSEGW